MIIVPGSAFFPKRDLGDSCNNSLTDPYWANVVLLMHMNGVNDSTSFIDETGKTITPFGAVKISTAQSKFCGASASGFTNVYTERLEVPASLDFSLGVTFTVECFVFTADSSGSNNVSIDMRSGGGGVFYIKNSTDRRIGYYHANGSSPDQGTAYPLNEWFHVAWVQISGVMKGYLNGVEQWSYTPTHSFSSSTAPTIGNTSIGILDYFGGLDGYIDELRITKGVARYTADFTPPTTPFPNN